MENSTQNKKPIQIELEVGEKAFMTFKKLKKTIEKLCQLDIGENELKIKVHWRDVDFEKDD